MDVNFVHQTGRLATPLPDHSTWLGLFVLLFLALLARYIFEKISVSLEINPKRKPSFLLRSEAYMKEFWEKD